VTGKLERRIRRVLMTGDTVSEVWTFTLELARALAANNIEVVLATFGALPSEEQISDASNIPNLCLLGSNFKLAWMEDPWKDIEESGRWLRKLEREYRPDLIHLNSFGHGGLRWHAPAVLTAHSCVMSWWEAVKREPAPAKWKKYSVETSRSLHGADLITVPSSAMAASLERHYGLERSRCRVIPNGRSTAEVGRFAKEPFIFVTGRAWDEARNIQLLASVARQIPWPVYVAGDSGTSKIKNCRLLGLLPARDLANWYARASIYAVPARYEPFGLSVLEAAHSGCALVLGDIPSLREVWGDAALFVSPDDAAGLRTALTTLTADPDFRAAMSAAALIRGLRFEASGMSEQYLQAYAEAIAAKATQCVS
jgi:glycogen(starch) synthase